jgi:hypothetical protein
VPISRGVKPWPPDNPDVIPDAPADPPGRLPRLRSERPAELWRLHKEEDPNLPKSYPRGKWRFDSPTGRYPVTYANVSKHHVFAEVFGDVDDAQIIEDEADRKLSWVAFTRSIQVVDLGDAEVLRALKLDLRVSTTIDYPRTMRWSDRLHDWMRDAEGIRYLGRKGGREDNYCLFLDRCADALDWRRCGTLIENEELVLEASDMFDLVFDFTIPNSWSSGSRWP